MKPPVVMIHGAFCGGWVFDAFRARFEAQGYTVQCPDLRFHDMNPHSPPAPALGTMGLLDYLNDLEGLLDGLDEKPVLVGHSMGGLLCQMLAARGCARGLILLAPSAPWGVLPSTSLEILSAQGLLLFGRFWNSIVRPDFHLAAEHTLDRLTRRDQAEIFARFVPESGRAMFEILHWPADPIRASMVHARDVRCPVLCLVGKGDRVNPPGTVRRIAARYRERAAMMVLPGHSHWLIGEPGWEDVAGHCLAWLQDLPA